MRYVSVGYIAHEEGVLDLYEAIRMQLAGGVPFVGHVGISVESVAAGKAIAAMKQRPQTSNHISTQHAGALFTLGETASGAAMAGTFADLLGELLPVAAEAKIAFLRPAKGRILATAATEVPVETLRARLAEDGKIRFLVNVALTDEAQEGVATMTVDWSVRRRKRG